MVVVSDIDRAAKLTPDFYQVNTKTNHRQWQDIHISPCPVNVCPDPQVIPGEYRFNLHVVPVRVRLQPVSPKLPALFRQ
jgi:hypothetical protein